MKTTNVYGNKNLQGTYNIICPYCGKRMKPIVYSHNDIVDNKPDCYKFMQGTNGTSGGFMICSSCNEMFFGYTPNFNVCDTHISHLNASLCGNANMCIQVNIDPNVDILTTIENIFKEKKMDITVYRPYTYKKMQMDNGVSCIILYNDNNQDICTIYGINVDKFINDNVKVLK